MFILTYKINYDILDEKIEFLQINDIYNVYYDAPLEITTDEYGYGYIEKDDCFIELKVAFDGTSDELADFNMVVDKILNSTVIRIDESNEDYSTFDFPVIHINDDWAIGSPEEIIDGKNKINFISQGAFGTGLHETTQDILRVILTELDLKDKSVLDIGTGSGILSIASSMAGAKKVTAIDIRDVKDEVELNASLNELTNINVLVGDVLSNEIRVNENYDWIYINIGGAETQLFMEFIKQHLNQNGTLLVSGLVEWSFNDIKDFIEVSGFELQRKYQTNEWITAIFK